MLTENEQLELIGFFQDRARAYRLAGKRLEEAAGELLGRRYQPALDILVEAEQLIGHDIIAGAERIGLREDCTRYGKCCHLTL